MKAEDWQQKVAKSLYVSLMILVAVGSSFPLLFATNKDRVTVPAAGLGLALALCSVSFSYARTVKESSIHYDELVFAGERFLRAALFFAMASIFMYSLSEVLRHISAGGNGDAANANSLHRWELALGLPAFITFVLGVVLVEKGVVILIGVTHSRGAKRRLKGHTLFLPQQEYSSLLAEEVKKDEVKAAQGNDQKL